MLVCVKAAGRESAAITKPRQPATAEGAQGTTAPDSRVPMRPRGRDMMQGPGRDIARDLAGTSQGHVPALVRFDTVTDPALA